MYKLVKLKINLQFKVHKMTVWKEGRKSLTHEKCVLYAINALQSANEIPEFRTGTEL